MEPRDVIFGCVVACFLGSLLLGVLEVLGVAAFLRPLFFFGPIARELDEFTTLPPGLASTVDGQTANTKYRVIPGHICLFRRKYPLLNSTSLEMKSTISWTDGRLRTTGRYPLGPVAFCALWLIVWTGFCICMLVAGSPMGGALLLVGGIVWGSVIEISRSLALRNFSDFSAEVRAAFCLPLPKTALMLDRFRNNALKLTASAPASSENRTLGKALAAAYGKRSMTISVRQGRVVGATFLIMIVVAGAPSSAHGESETVPINIGTLDVSKVRLLSLGVRRNTEYAIADLELVNSDTHPFIYAGDSESRSPDFHRQCFVDKAWTTEQASNCGTGLSTLTLEPGQHVRFSTSLCADGARTKIGVRLGNVGAKSGDVVWSDEIDAAAVQ